MAKINLKTEIVAKQIQRVVSSQQTTISKRPALQQLNEEIMRSEAERLTKCIERQILNYYASYSPVIYERTGELPDAVHASPSVRVLADGKTLEATVEIKSIAGHSVFGGGSVDQIEMIDKGWAVKKDVWFRDIPHFGYQAGFEFVERGIADFLKSNPYGLTVTRA